MESQPNFKHGNLLQSHLWFLIIWEWDNQGCRSPPRYPHDLPAKREGMVLVETVPTCQHSYQHPMQGIYSIPDPSVLNHLLTHMRHGGFGGRGRICSLHCITYNLHGLTTTGVQREAANKSQAHPTFHHISSIATKAA